MKLVTAEQMRELDRRTIEEYEVKGEVLMERAGQGVASIVRRLAEVCGFPGAMIHLIAGRGNNGGDAFVAARALKESGCAVEVWLAGSENQVRGDALIHLSRMKKAGIELIELPTVEDWDAAAREPFYAEIVVDGVLGTGLTGPARGPAVGAIQYIKTVQRDALCVSIDIPSGLNADSGAAEGDAVTADVTVTMGLPKIGMVKPSAIDYIGTLEVIDIGIPGEAISDVERTEPLEFIHAADMRSVFPRRPRSSHKGTYGHAWIIGGSRRFSGACSLAGIAALKSGAGLVTAIVPSGIHAVTASVHELMVVAGEDDESGFLTANSLAAMEDAWPQMSAVLAGPGMGNRDETRSLVEDILGRAGCPVVLDADALNVFAGDAAALAGLRKGSMVLTPHPGELARLLGVSTTAVQADRFAHAQKAAELTGAVVVLKGAGTLVASPEQTLRVNMTGNPGMATGGAGDVLAGMITGFIAQGIAPWDAARAGVYLHGKAGDFAAWRKCQAGMIAGDILDEIPYALRDLMIR